MSLKGYYANYEKTNTRICVRIFVIIVAFAIIAFALSSCKTVQPIEQTDHRDSVRVMYIHDSTYIYDHDSVFIDRYMKNDTVWLTKEMWRTSYKTKEVAVHDTIYRDREQVIVQTERYIPQFYKGSTIALWCIVVAFVIYVVIRIIIKIYARR